MNSANLTFVKAAAVHEDHDDEPFALAVREAIEADQLFPSLLRSNLEDRGFTVNDNPLKTLHQVLVIDDDGLLVAMGAASDKHEAILAAALGWFREHPARDLEATKGLRVIRSE